MSEFGEVIDEEVIVEETVEQEDAPESFGDVILSCEIKTYRNRNKVSAGTLSGIDMVAVRQRRHDKGRKYGDEYSFELSDHQKATLDKWHKIYEDELEKDKQALERRMKRHQSTHGGI